ncbi:type I-E CRISPR-associated protein Cse1/CasA [Streptomyces sp. NBC_01795]|uniref:type I-E CRISPR-associated protein Cse1/CasA n=1 Tax=unclassified Streptomyces TaxID=2593676 RepID=UPI002DDBCAA5|nr:MULTISPECIES: type I-E CRISPR-associated protein Cse1/CasA [unclassified Streptomyces]WSA94713.1 type I-E CRISPR-associated protein Cse1/CasA [Streptomyces sp. NBC_01795]WSB79133.1 type I-E CRISPR-associated protein Cse1/CasA [Streptomyces sp. NBC_01775]WSS12665.1 type I-E CRISPR-associated protein Cse1/CasA [Streptomyces sp. NBC_01186]
MVNLVDDAWLPAQWKGGGRERVSLRVALTRAGELRGLAIEPPTLLSAVMRHVLLPVWFSALGQPSSRAEWRDRFERGGLDAQQGQLLDLYLDTWRSSFDLFSPERPFAQVAGLETSAGETKPVSLLVPSVATGNNVPMFTSFTEAHAYEMTPEDAALWLLHAQCWDTAAIKTGAKDDEQAKKGKTTGNPTGPLGQLGVILPEGRTLYETLLLNTLVSWDAKAAGNAAGVGREDYPQWQSPEPHTSSWRKRPAAGPLDTLTWQSRRIRLVPEDTADGVRVRRVVVCAGDRLAARPEPACEPHTAWNYSAKPKKGETPMKPRRHRPGEHAWRGLAALLALGREEDGDGPRTSELLQQVGDLQSEGCLPEAYPLQVLTCGLEYGNMSAVVEDAAGDRLPVPTAALVSDSRVRHLVLEAAEQAEGVTRALNGLSADLRRAQGAEPLPWDKGQRPGMTFLQAVDLPMRRLLLGMQKDADDEDRIEAGMGAWEEILHRLAWDTARSVLASASPTTFAGRKAGESKTYRAADAERIFRKRLRDILYRAADARMDDGHDTYGDDDAEGEEPS